MNYFTIRLPKDDEFRIVLIAKFIILGFLLGLVVIFFLEFLKPKLFQKFRTIEDAFSALELVKKNRGK